MVSKPTAAMITPVGLVGVGAADIALGVDVEWVWGAECDGELWLSFSFSIRVVGVAVALVVTNGCGLNAGAFVCKSSLS